MKHTILLTFSISCVLLLKSQNPQREFTVSIPTEKYNDIARSTTQSPNSQKVFALMQEIVKAAKQIQQYYCFQTLNPEIEKQIKEVMKDLDKGTPYILTVDYDACKFISLVPDHGTGEISHKSWTIYHILLTQEIRLEPVIKKEENTGNTAPLLATFKNDNGQWIAMGPYMTTDEFASEQQAIGSLFYADTDLTFLCERGKFRIYKLNVKIEHQANDIRYALKQFGINDIPN